MWLWTLVPIVFLITWIVRYHVDVPQGDQWSLLPLVEKSYQGTLTVQDFFAPIGGHRIPLSRLWMLVLIRISSCSLCVRPAIGCPDITPTISWEPSQRFLDYSCWPNPSLP